MRNARLEEAQAGIKIAGRNINDLRYAALLLDTVGCPRLTLYILASSLYALALESVISLKNTSSFIGRMVLGNLELSATSVSAF